MKPKLHRVIHITTPSFGYGHAVEVLACWLVILSYTLVRSRAALTVLGVYNFLLLPAGLVSVQHLLAYWALWEIVSYMQQKK